MIAHDPQFGHAGMYLEEREFDRALSESNAFASSEDVFFAKAKAAAADPNIIKAVKAQYPFDDGWAFWFQQEKVYGAQIPPGPQDVGDCVGYSDVLSLCDLMGQEIYCGGDAEDAFVPYVPWSYGAGRIYIGGNRLRGDGSLGSWQVQADVQYGYLASDLSGLTIRPNEPAEPDASTTRRWASSRSILDQWKDKAAPHKVAPESTARLSTAESCRKAVVEHYRPLTIASNWGFRSRGFDSKYGITLWTRSGSWAHQMHIRGIFEIKSDWFVYVGNQWGLSYHGDPGRGYPRGGFIIPYSLFEQWVPQASVYGRSNFLGRVLEVPDFSIV